MSFVLLLAIIDFVILGLGLLMMFLGLDRNSDKLFYTGISLIVLFIAISIVIVCINAEENDVVYVPVVIPIWV